MNLPTASTYDMVRSSDGRWNPKSADPRNRLGKFAPVPHWLAARRYWQDRFGNVRRLSAICKLLYADLLRTCGPDGRAVATLAKLAGNIGASARQVSRVLADLEEIGLVWRHGRRGHGLANVYEFRCHEWMLGLPELLTAPTPAAERRTRPAVDLQPDLPDLFPAATRLDMDAPQVGHNVRTNKIEEKNNGTEQSGRARALVCAAC